MPNRPLKPDQLGKVVASKIASEPAKQRRFSFRNSVFIGRVTTGLALAVLILGLSIPVFAAISWLQGLLETDANAVENPLAGDDGGAFADLTDFLASALGLGDASSPPLLGDGGEGPEPGESPSASGAESTTSTAGDGGSSSTTIPGATTSTTPGGTTSTTSPPGSTTSSTPSSTTSTTIGSTTSTTVGSTTTTTIGSTTTTTAPTTTTTSSCGNQSGNGNGKGRGNC